MALNSKWVGNLLRFYDGAQQILDIDGDNALIDANAIKLGGVAVTADTLAQALGLNGTVATVASADETQKLPTSQSTVVPGAPGDKVQDVTITLKDADGDALTGVREVTVYMATDAGGATPSSSGAGTSVTATTGAVLKADTAKLVLRCITDANGVLVLHFDNTGGGGAYTDRVVLVLPSGNGVKVSAALAVPNA